MIHRTKEKDETRQRWREPGEREKAEPGKRPRGQMHAPPPCRPTDPMQNRGSGVEPRSEQSQFQVSQPPSPCDPCSLVAFHVAIKRSY